MKKTDTNLSKIPLMWLDGQERLIVRELVKNPRISDNQITKNTSVPLKTVNRKRKILEEKNVLKYFAYLDVGIGGLGIYPFRQLYTVKLKEGITISMLEEYFKKSQEDLTLNTNFTQDSWIGEVHGNLAVVFIAEAMTENQLINFFNGHIIPGLKKEFGKDAVAETKTVRLGKRIRFFRNYLPFTNIENGTIKKDWPNENIFTDTIKENARKKFD
ncbi:MAG: winged helix-turn-helix domain-containing protein [archaeon]|nr:winged helix-turn-helix domain-containing protein [archaeon]